MGTATDRGAANPLCSIGAGRTVLHIRPGPALGRSAGLYGNTPALNGIESSHVQTGPLCTWENITVTSTIHTNPVITQKTHRRPARALLSNVQYPRDRPEKNPAPPDGALPKALTRRLGPARTSTGDHDPPIRPVSSHRGELGHRAFLTRRLPNPRASAPGDKDSSRLQSASSMVTGRDPRQPESSDASPSISPMRTIPL